MIICFKGMTEGFLRSCNQSRAHKFISNTVQPYTPANPPDTVMSNTGSTHPTKANTGQLYTQNYPSNTTISKPVSTYRTKANVSPTRSKGICNCRSSGRDDLFVWNTIAQFLILPLFRLHYKVSSNT